MEEQPVDLIVSDEKPSIFWQDEILQVMYWMRGEGFGEKIVLSDLRRFLDASDEVLTANLSHLIEKNLVVLDLSGKYQLTETGVREGGRRFADEFDGMLRQGHYECNDPDCDCHDPASNAECKHFAPHAH